MVIFIGGFNILEMHRSYINLVGYLSFRISLHVKSQLCYISVSLIKVCFIWMLFFYFPCVSDRPISWSVLGRLCSRCLRMAFLNLRDMSKTCDGFSVS
jgi:hypothetical protein